MGTGSQRVGLWGIALALSVGAVAACGSAQASLAPSPTPTALQVQATSTAPPSPTASPLPTLNATPFTDAQWGPSWRVAVAMKKSKDYTTAVDGLKPPLGVYVLNWTEAAGCPGDRGLLAAEGSTWEWGGVGAVWIALAGDGVAATRRL